jgi:hypothetical protein
MATAAARLSSPARTRPTAWDALMPSEEGERIPWQVWMRRKGAGYWLMRWATKLCRLTVKVERLLGRDVPDAPPNPNGLEEPATVWSEDEAKDVCRIVYRNFGGRVAVTYGPLLVGRVHPFAHVKAGGDRRFKVGRSFNPFETYDFSATDAVKEQATRVLVDVSYLDELRAILTGALEKPHA